MKGLGCGKVGSVVHAGKEAKRKVFESDLNKSRDAEVWRAAGRLFQRRGEVGDGGVENKSTIAIGVGTPVTFCVKSHEVMVFMVIMVSANDVSWMQL